MPEKIAAFGDSILKGAVTGYSDHLFDILPENSLTLAQKKMGFELFNDSVFGSTISKTQRRLNKFFEKGENADIIIIESGGNDCDYDWNVFSSPSEISEPPVQRTPLSEFMKILDQMIQAIKQNKAIPVIMTIPSLVADYWYTHVTRSLNEAGRKAADLFLGENPIDRLSKNHEIYNLNLIEYCIKNGIFMVDMRKALLETADYRTFMCRDGIHPNEKGYEFMSHVWERELPKLF